MHGVTTVFGGNCGFTLAPAADEHVDYLARLDGARSRASRSRRCNRACRGTGSRSATTSSGSRRSGTAVNAGFLAGHSALRRVVMGADAVGEAGDRRADHRDGAAAARRARRRRDGLLHVAGAHAQRRRRQSGAVARRDRATSCCAWRARCTAIPGTQLELIIAGCLNGFTDDDVDLLTAMSLAADRPLNWNVLGVTQGRHAREAARSRHARRGVGRARRRAHAAARACRSGCRSSPASCSTASPAGARRSRLPVPERIRALSDPGGARPPRRAGALARSRRAREPRALGAARGDRGVHAARRKAFEGRQHRRHREGAGQGAVRRAARHRDRRRAAHRPAPQLRRARARRDVEDARRRVARPARDDRRLRRGRAPRHDERRRRTRRSWSATRCATATSRSRKPCTCSPTSPRASTGSRDRGRIADGRVRRHRVLRPRRPSARSASAPTTTCPAARAASSPSRSGVTHVLVNGTEIVRDAAYTGATPGTAAAVRARHRHRPRSIHGGLMYTQESDGANRATARRVDRRASSPTCSRSAAPTTRSPCTTRCRRSARCTAAPGMFGGHSVHVVELRRRHVGAASIPRCSRRRTSSTSATTCRSSRCRSTRPSTRKYRRMLDPEFSPKKMAALEPEARALVNEIIDRFVDTRRVRVPRRLRDAAAVDDLPRARRAPAERPARLPAAGATTRSGPEAKTPEEVDAKRQAAGQAINDYFVDGARGEAREPRRPAAQPRS